MFCHFSRAVTVVTLLSALLSAGQYNKDKTDSRVTRCTLRILGFFSYQGSDWNGEYVIPAARLAVDEINKNANILPDCKLELVEADSGCDRDQGVRELVRNAVQGVPNPPVAILGAGCSSSSIPIASIAGRNNILLPQVSYASTSQSLSFIDSYPYFYRVVPSDDGFIEAARVKLMQEFNWKRYGIHNAELSGSNEVWIDHSIAALREGIRLHIPGAEEVYFLKSDQQITTDNAFEKVVSAGMRVGMLYGLNQTVIGDLLCVLYHSNLIYPHIIWMMTDIGVHHQLHSPNCTVPEMRQATQGIIYLGHQFNSTKSTVFDITNQTFQQYYDSYINESRKYADEKGENYSTNSWATFTYDSVWTLGLALHKAEKKLSRFNSSLANFSLGNYNVSKTILEEIANISFVGASGTVSFNDVHQRQFLDIAIHQVQNGALKRIGHYSPSKNSSVLGELCLDEASLLWSTDGPPLDSFPIETLLASTWAGILMYVLLTVGLIWNNFSLLINLCYQNFPSIKSSSPRLNYLMFAGNNILLLAGFGVVIKVTEEYKTVVFGTLCQSIWWLFDIGLLLVLNITLLKSWRIFRIFNSFTPGRFLSDEKFIAITIAWIIINSAYHVIFVMANSTSSVTVKVLPRESFVRQKIIYCNPSNWWGISFVPHFVMSIILCMLVFFIRKVQDKQFNDAKNIAIFYYINFLVVSICVCVSYVISPGNGTYNALTVTLILDSTGILCIVYTCQLTLFLPKMLPLFRHLYHQR